MAKINIDQQTFDNLQLGLPYKSYRKTILGNVLVKAVNSFSGEPENILLHGNPRRLDRDSYINVWSPVEDAFFRKSNRRHLEEGRLIQFTLPTDFDEPVPEPYANTSDEELKNILSQKFFAIESALRKTNSEAILFRFLSVARESEKSEKIINKIKERLSAVQAGDLEEIEIEE